MVKGRGQPAGRSVTGAAVGAKSTGVGFNLEMARAAVAWRSLVRVVFMAVAAGYTGMLTFEPEG